MQTIEQKRAKQALAEVQTIVALKSEKIKTNFLSCVNELPAMIHMNGLGQAMAFYKSKKESEKQGSKEDNQYKGMDAHTILFMILSDWLCGDKGEIYTEEPYS